jgi:hypothetical protein
MRRRRASCRHPLAWPGSPAKYLQLSMGSERGTGFLRTADSTPSMRRRRASCRHPLAWPGSPAKYLQLRMGSARGDWVPKNS